MSSLLILTSLVFSLADDEPKYQFALRKAQDAIEVKKDEKRTLFIITSQTGIGDGSVTLTEGRWPRDIVLRLRYDKERGFNMLESFTLATERFQVSGSQRTSGKMELYFLSPEGKAEALTGHVNVIVQERAGALEVTLPAHLLAGTKAVKFGWIDAFRR